MAFVMADAASAATVTINPDKTISIDGKKTFMVILSSDCNLGYENAGFMTPCNASVSKDFGFTSTIGASTQPNFAASVASHNNNGVYWVLRGSDNIPSLKDQPMLYAIWLSYDEPTYGQEWPPHIQSVCNSKKSQYGSGRPAVWNSVTNKCYWPDDRPLVKQFYLNIKSLDSTHPVILTHWKDIYKWDEDTYADIHQFDEYVWFKEGTGAWARADGAYGWENSAGTAALPTMTDLGAYYKSTKGKPIFAVLQGQGYEVDFGSRTLITPTEKEIRVNSWTAITADVRGIEYWGYKNWGAASPTAQFPYATQGLYGTPAIEWYKKVAREIRNLNDVLVLPTIANSWHYKQDHSTVKFDPDPMTDHNIAGTKRYKLNYILKRDSSGTNYLIVVNKDVNPVQNIGITISGLSGTKNAKTIGIQTSGSGVPGRTLIVTNGKFTDSFDGYAAHIYQICSGTCPASPNPNPTPTCTDSIQNQGERGIDCGGPCNACSSSPNQLTLKPGWNQISSPLAAGLSLATIESSCTILPYKNQKLWAWNATAQVWTNPAKVEPFKGYWIYTAYQCTVPLSGSQATFTSLPLVVGWNKISASGTFSAIQGTCSGHITGNWVWNWDKATEKWSHPATMQLDKGYWIKVDQNCVLGG